MNTRYFFDSLRLSLDHDLKEVLELGDVHPELIVLTQILRIMRGRPFHVDMQSQPDGAWSADGSTWLPKAPGT
jgi:hypothetical protein